MFWSKQNEKGKGLPFKNGAEKNPAFIVRICSTVYPSVIKETVNLGPIERSRPVV